MGHDAVRDQGFFRQGDHPGEVMLNEASFAYRGMHQRVCDNIGVAGGSRSSLLIVVPGVPDLVRVYKDGIG